MPIEIKELQIKGVISDGTGQPSGPATVSEEEKQAIIAAAVEKILQILEDKKSR